MAPILRYSATLVLLASRAFSQRIVIPSHTSSGQNSITQWVSGPSGFDAPKSRPINETSYEWWYFDVVAEPDAIGQQPSIGATFHTTGNQGFDVPHRSRPAPYPSSNFIQFDLAWPNGTTDSWMFFAGDAEAAAHYTCGPNEKGQRMSLAPGAGWINAIPDGYGEADFEIRGRRFKFEGRGYHDHNFGNRPFSHSYAASYWGHGRLGDYAVVWADTLTPSGENIVSAYVARGGEIITAHCGGIRVRPYGANSTYPPTTSTGAPTGFNLDISIPEGQLQLQADTTYVIVDVDVYQRVTGTFTGTLDGERLPDGTSLWEQFTLQE
ncbi:uncharacterized protein BDV14DRAFT_195911 [Aspergillus stella-maris]|uniref:uncharacterized protein n=1 Tax=Aspergillus stella-maris TaxID=1810926 RepID=UPI003CCE0BC8